MLRLDRSLEDIIQQLEKVRRRFPDDVDFTDFEEKVKDGIIQVFPIREDSVMVGQIHGDTVRILAAAGRLRDILDYLPIFCDWYLHNGCVLATLGGRRGWSRFLIDMGWQYGDYDGELVKDLTR